VDVPVIRQEMGSDPASVAYDTLSHAVADGADVVLIDTAGRLHNKVGLMNELTKIRNVMNKVVEGAPDDVLLVLDGSTGQNAFEQAKQFTLATKVTQLAITKLDGTAKGGVVIGISDQFKVPVKYVGRVRLWTTCRYSTRPSLWIHYLNRIRNEAQQCGYNHFRLL
jgi:fused signal recognition particle receptor